MSAAIIHRAESGLAGGTGHRYVRIRVGIILTGLSIFAQLYLFQPILDEVALFFGVRPTAASLVVSAGTVGMALGLFLFLFRADALPRKRLMLASLLISSVLTVITTGVSSLSGLLLLSLARGFALSGVSAVALAYIAEEIPPGAVGVAIALYLSGNTLGGMFGRVVSSLVCGWHGWQTAALVVGLGALVLGLIFWGVLPEGRGFRPDRVPVAVRFARMRRFLRTPFFLAVYLVGFLIMGSFVSVYNYMAFRLEGAPYHLPHHVVSFIFLLYVIGVVGSLVFGRLSDRRSPQRLLQLALSLYLVGVGLMALPWLPALIVGLACFTLAFFASHTLASRMVSTHAGVGRSSATCLYWIFYYVGSSLLGYLTGWVYFAGGWLAFLGVNALLLGAGLWLASRFLADGEWTVGE